MEGGKEGGGEGWREGEREGGMEGREERVIIIMTETTTVIQVSDDATKKVNHIEYRNNRHDHK